MNDDNLTAYTEEEVREKFLDHVRGMVRYWDSVGESKRDALDGLAFSIMVLLDGGTGLPAFSVLPRPHPDDEAFCRGEGERWYSSDVDISGPLHEQLAAKR